jgi:MFS family permease
VNELRGDPHRELQSGARWRGLPRTIWVLGWVSLLMDVSSELVHSLLPIFMTTVLGASMLTVGVVEGIAEATAAITKVFSGALSDWVGRRKALVVTGYAFSALTKPFFPLAQSMLAVLAARFLDRVGKGVRDAPRDALIADVTHPAQRGAAYGLRQSLDSIGAFIGPLIAMAALLLWADNIRAVLWVAVVPALLAVALLVWGVREPERPVAADSPRAHLPLSRAALRALPGHYWWVVALGAVFALARFSEAFLVLRAQQVGVPLRWVPGVMLLMSVVYALLAYPAGVLADRWPARRLLVLGLLTLIAADALLALAQGPGLMCAGAAVWGVYMGLTQGLLSKLVADVAPAALRGTAFGVFNLVNGVSLLLASVLAGALWSACGAGATFAAGGVFAGVAVLGLLLLRR